MFQEEAAAEAAEEAAAVVVVAGVEEGVEAEVEAVEASKDSCATSLSILAAAIWDELFWHVASILEVANRFRAWSGKLHALLS